nr:hypothetical protein [Cereibacter sphaeroides]
MTAIVSVRDLVKTYDTGFRALKIRQPRHSRGRDPRAPRPERRRQDHAHLDDLRHRAPELRARSRWAGHDIATGARRGR